MISEYDVPGEPSHDLAMSGHDDETHIVPPSDETHIVPPNSDAPTILTPSGPSHGSQVSRMTSAGAGRRAAAPAPGARRVGDYDLQSEIARGGMGIVYRAHQLSLNRPVAFKMILAGQFASGGDVERFHVEAEAAAGFDHPNIVPIYEVGEFEGNHFFTMKLIDGRSMAQDMPRLVKAPRDGVRLLVKICRAIHYAHQHSILHRDLKPANILLDSQNEPHVTDFGLAKRTGGDSQLTQTGTIVGTPSYMAPEQAAPSKIPLTTAADVYSLGAMLYEVLTGRPPFRGDSPLDTLMLVLNKEVERPRSVNAAVDRDLETIALKCLEKDPARRYGSAEALAEDLDRWLNHEPILARPIGTTERVVKWAQRRPAIAALAAAIAAVTVLGVAGVIWQWREAVYQRGQTATALMRVEDEVRNTALARDKEAAQRLAAENAQQQEAVARRSADDQRAIAETALGAAERNLYFNNIDLADREWTANNIGHVDQLLAASPLGMRNWEWRYLNRLAHMESASFAAGTAPIAAMSVERTGGRATTVSEDLTVRVWDLRSGRLDRTIKLGAGAGLEMILSALSADGRVFVASLRSFDKGLLVQENDVWDLTTGKLLWKLPDVSLIGFTAFAVSPDGSRVVAAAPDTIVANAGSGSQVGSRLRAWDGRSGGGMTVLGVIPGNVTALTFSPDGSRLIAGSSSSAPSPSAPDLRVLDAQSGAVVATLNHSGEATATFSPDGRWIAGNVAAGVGLWSAAGGDERWTWSGKSTKSMAFSPGGQQLAVVAADRSIHLLDAASGEDRGRFTGNSSVVGAVGFAGTNRDLLSAETGRVRLFRLQEESPALTGDGAATDTFAAVGIAPDRRRLLGVLRDGGIRGWDLTSGKTIYAVPARTPTSADAFSAAMNSSGPLAARMFFSGDGRRMTVLKSATMSTGSGPLLSQSVLFVYDTTTGAETARLVSAANKPLPPPPAAASGVTPVARPIQTSMGMGVGIDADGTHFALATMKMSLTFVSSPVSTQIAGVNAPKISVSGTEVEIWNASSPRPSNVLMVNDAMVVSTQFSPDGSRLVLLAGAYSSDGPVAAEYRVYDVSSGRMLIAFPGDKQSAPIVFSRDGRWLAAETVRHTVTIWDLTNRGARPVVLPEQTSSVTKLAFSPDATRIAALTSSGVTLFDTRSGSPLLTLHESKGPYSNHEFFAPGKITTGSTLLEFSVDGRYIIETIVATDPKGIKVQIKTWDGGL